MAFTLTFEIDDEMVAEVQRVGKEYYQVELKESDVEKPCRDYPRLIDEAIQKSISDSFPRDYIGGWLAEQCGEDDWPCCGTNPKETKAFYEKFSVTAVERGWIPEGCEIVPG